MIPSAKHIPEEAMLQPLHQSLIMLNTSKGAIGGPILLSQVKRENP
jgi:hypothetical protein